jgi:hypothetical protein
MAEQVNHFLLRGQPIQWREVEVEAVMELVEQVRREVVMEQTTVFQETMRPQTRGQEAVVLVVVLYKQEATAVQAS